MRKKTDSRRISGDALSLESVAKALSDLQKRLERLEVGVFGEISPPLTTPKPKRGRKVDLDPKELVERRNRLISWLERTWPQLSVDLRKATTPQHAMEAIERTKEIQEYAFMPRFYWASDHFPDQLWQFIQSKRFRGNPRNLAGAMAGLPELSWKRSFDVCTRKENRALQPLDIHAYWDYMRRKFPDRLRELLAAQSVSEIQRVLRKSPSNDPHYVRLKKNPGKVLEWLHAGRPG
jgi:hypothetical protein